MTKQCTKCKEWKPLSEFSKHLPGKNGLRARCRKCCNYHYKKYRQTKRAKLLRRKSDEKYRQTLIGHLYHRFNTIKQRCVDSTQKCYKNYGGRGIKCLFKSSDEFVNYIINELQIDPRGLQIDRIDNDGHYEKGNIRFVTCKENNNNRRKRKK